MTKRTARRPARPPKRPRAKRTTPARVSPSRPASPAPRHAIERALAAFAHDVRTPLTGIMALSELLATSELGARERSWVEALKSSADHLVALTTLVVDAARAEVEGIVLRDEAFDLPAFVAAIAESIAVRAGTKGLKTHSEISSDLPTSVIGDPVRLRGAVENLIDNAVKFTETGALALHVTSRPARGGRVRVTIAITDTGIGMSGEEMRRLFRPFVQASEAVARRFGGSGLGLSLVKRLAEAMGGDLSVKSRPGKGSTFTLSVVLARPAASEEREAGAAVVAAPSRPCRILCAEDNPYGRVILATILKELGHGVDFVGTGHAAVSAVAAGGFDLVLMDVTLPNGDGIEATRRIRALPGHEGAIPIVGVSGLSSAEEEARARAAGMSDYLAKPISPARLAKAIAAVTRAAS